MRIVFLGTPDFAVPSLRKLIKDEGIQVLAVITQPDKPVGRHRKLTPPPVKVLAEENHLLVMQPEKISSDHITVETLKTIKPDVLVTAAYGQILKENILDLAPYGVVNLHSSVLPAYRGPAPMNWAIINGESKTGVTTMDTVLKIDAGDILEIAEVDIEENETSEELSQRLAEIGSDLLIQTIHKLGKIKPRAQDREVQASPDRALAPFMDKKLGHIDFKQKEFVLKSPNPKQSDFEIVKENNAQNIHNLVRGTYPWPGAAFEHGEHTVKLLKTKVVKAEQEAEILNGKSYKPGQIAGHSDSSIYVQTQNGLLEMLLVKPAGKKEMDAHSWFNGAHLKIGDQIG